MIVWGVCSSGCCEHSCAYLVLHLLSGMAGPWGVCTLPFTRQCLAFLLLGRKAMTNLENILKSKDSTLPTKIHIVKVTVFPIVIYRYESWIIKKDESLWTDAFKLQRWRRLLSPLHSREIKPVYPKGNQPWTFIWRTDAEAEALILWPPDAKTWLTGKDSDGGKDWRQRRRWQQRMRWLESMVDLMDKNLSKLQEIVENIGAWCAAVRGVAKSQSRLSRWITTSCY